MPPDVGAYARAMLFQGARDEGQSVIMGLQALTGVQQRDPLADRELIEFCHAIPSSQLRRRGENRWLVRRLMANRLPSEILNGAFGQQAADSHQRTTRQLPAIRAELEAAREDPMLSEMVDVDRLLTAIGNWPEQQPLSHEEHADFRLLRNGLHRAITTVRYVKWIRGTNR
jgi:asparagine synthase (glutamine-hydrolysing)